ncbi:MAG: hypothetical protein PHV37_09740 [Candidatus Gastranaerophilales bacterium]|nr:hypothetical protein [Candidatus Gastranaerophilales bacterium]
MYNNTIYPGYINYTGINNRIVKKKEDEEKSNSSSQAATKEAQREAVKGDSFSRSQFPTGAQGAIDYSNPKVNISQIITDFKNTTVAIGAPDDVKNEVTSYLDLIEKQAQKDEPSKQIIQSNLKNASQILDTYITTTLQKPSKVVENWIDALFLQQVDYKSNPKDINPAYKLDVPDDEVAVVETVDEPQKVQEENVIAFPQKNSDIYIPEDKQLRKMFIQAKKYSSIDQDEKALDAFSQTLNYAEQAGDKQAQGMVYYEVAKIYDRNDYLPDAIKSYDKALENTESNNIKARSHISMAKIYDDVVQFEPAVDHYYAAISYAGESENIPLQTKALTNLADMFSNRYDKSNAFDYLDLANQMAQETKSNKVIASTYRRSADISEKLDENLTALDYYKESTRYYTKTDSLESIISNYRDAAKIMLKLGDSQKAKTLLGKAFVKSQSLEIQN